ncbi:MAG: cation:dicarboxylase symporter family transporter, partial [Eggerthellaceae bacterium]|nr:cation:dicarboxylase symporter family transporter [Eggerthellaceae bacterium]
MSGAASKSAQEPKKSTNLTTWILISLVAGIVCGIICSMVVPDKSPIDVYLIEGVFYVFGQWFIRLMQMLVVPLVFCSIVCGAASMSDPKLLGKVGVGTILMYLCTTALAVVIAIMLAQVLKPGIGLDMAAIVRVEPSTTSTDQTVAQMLINI